MMPLGLHGRVQIVSSTSWTPALAAMHFLTAHDDAAQALNAQEDLNAIANSPTVLMPDLTFGHPSASTSFVDYYRPSVPSPVSVDESFEPFSNLSCSLDMFTPLPPGPASEHQLATQPQTLQSTSTTTGLPSHSHSYSRLRSTPSSTALPLATPFAPPTITLDTLVLPAGVREEALPAGFRHQLVDVRCRPCAECSTHGRKCVQTNGASWKCRECMRMARGHCDWHVRTGEQF